MRIGNWLSALAFLIFFWSPAALEAQDLSSFERRQDSLRLAGNGGPMIIAQYVAKKINELNPQIAFSISEGSSEAALEQLKAGVIQIGGLSRLLTDEEKDIDGLISFPIALEGAAVVVNAENRLSGLSRDQLQAVFSGRINNWRQLGGRNVPINLYVLPPGNATRVIMDQTALEGVTPAASAQVMGSSPSMKDAIGLDPNGIGFINLTNLDILVKGLSFEGMAPGLENSSYQISRTIYLVTKGRPQGLARDFINFLQNPDGATLIREAGFTPTGR